MDARALFRGGKLPEAAELLSEELKTDPLNEHKRTFLFELLSFLGEYDRASKQLEVLSRGSQEAELGTLLYRGALTAEMERSRMFSEGELPEEAPPSSGSGTLNGVAFQTIADADSRIGPRLEVFAGGTYIWLPFQYIRSLRMAEPSHLRDLLWAPATLQVSPKVTEMELGEVFLPALAPLSWKSQDNAVRLGQATVWEEVPSGDLVPLGQKILLVDDREVPFLELRDLEITDPDQTI